MLIMCCCFIFFFFFFFNDTATTEIYTLSLHDALSISYARHRLLLGRGMVSDDTEHMRSEEHTSELQSPCKIVCRLLLEKKKKNLSDLLLQQLRRRDQSMLLRLMLG